MVNGVDGALTALRRLAPGLTSPVSGDDLAQRWGLRHSRCSSRPPASSSRCAMAQPHAKSRCAAASGGASYRGLCTGAAILCLVALVVARAEPAARPGLGAGLPDLRRDSPARCLVILRYRRNIRRLPRLRDDQPRRAGESATAVRRPRLSLGAAAHAPADAPIGRSSACVEPTAIYRPPGGWRAA